MKWKLGLYWGYIGVNIGIMENKMETTIMENQMEKKMEIGMTQRLWEGAVSGMM